jgi:tetratricopeptide (TPR) repeat protein
LQDLANEKRDRELYLQAAGAYKAYLAFFDEAKKAPAIRANLAESLYSAKQFLEAGRYYERAADGQKGKPRTESTYTAVVSYFEALKQQQVLSRLDVVEARAGLRRAGRVYVRENPKAANIREVKFNIARTYYDAGEFDDAIRLFTALVEQFPSAKEAPISAHLVLDAYRSKEDYEGLINAGKAFVAMGNLGDAQFKTEVAEIVKGAEENLLRSETIKAGGDEGGGTDKLEQIAEKYKGTTLGKRALLNAFVTARNSKDPERVFEVGEKLRRAYPSAKEVPDALSTMGKIALDSLQFARGAGYVEAAAKYKQGKEAADLHQAAGKIRVSLGDRTAAERNLNVLLRVGSSPQEKAELATAIARLHIEANDWDAVVSLLQRASAAGASSAQLSYMLGYALFRQGQLASAQGYLEQAVGGGRGGSDEDREAAAAAQFYLGEIGYKAFEAVELSSDLSQLGATLQQKLGFMAQTRQAYTAVGSLGSAVWTVAALGRLAAVDQNAAAALRGLQMPPGLPDEVVQQVSGALETQAKPLEAESKQALKQCAAAAMRLKVLSEAARSCLAGSAPTGDPQAKLVTVSVNRRTPAGAKKLQRVLAQRPRDLDAIEQLGRLYLKAGDPYMARMILGKGLEIKETAPLLTMVAVCSATLGDFQGALSLLDDALKKDTGYAQARVNKAALLAKFGYRKASAAEKRRVRGLAALTPDDPALLPDALSTIGAGGDR